MDNTPPFSGNKRERTPEEENARRMRARLEGDEEEEEVVEGDGDMLVTAASAPGIEMEEVVVPPPTAEQLNELMLRIIALPPETMPPAELAALQTGRASELMTSLNEIIERQTRAAEEREAAAQARTAAAMAVQDQLSTLRRRTDMITEVNNALMSSDERLNPAQRADLNRRIMELIRDYVTSTEVANDLRRDPTANNIRQLFNGLIQYFTLMAGEARQQAPYILANIGSILAGTIMIGSAIITPPAPTTDAGILMTLSSYMGTATVTASGLYFLQRGSVPVTQYLETMGECVRATCSRATGVVLNQLSQITNNAIEIAEQMIDALPTPDSSQDSMSSMSSTSTVLSDASRQLSIIQRPTVDEQREELLDGMIAPTNSPASSQISDITDIGGRKRKSRRHTKSKKSRKGKKGRKGSITKKGRKHHKTMKRYRSKMRR